MKFRKKPIVVDAVCFVEGSGREVLMWAGKESGIGISFKSNRYEGETLLIPTPEGEMRAMPGDYIIKGVNGEFYPCKPDIFEKTYEAAE